MSMSMSMINWNGRNAIISSYWVCLFTKFRWRLHRALRLAWITWIPFILWFSMIFKIGLNIVHGFMNATFIDDSLCQWSLTINVHSCIYEHTSCMINDHRNSYEHWSSMIIDIDYDSWRSMIVAMECCWSYMISVDHCIISWTLSEISSMFLSFMLNLQHTVTGCHRVGDGLILSLTLVHDRTQGPPATARRAQTQSHEDTCNSLFNTPQNSFSSPF